MAEKWNGVPLNMILPIGTRRSGQPLTSKTIICGST